jgi:hypothetical protein
MSGRSHTVIHIILSRKKRETVRVIQYNRNTGTKLQKKLLTDPVDNLDPRLEDDLEPKNIKRLQNVVFIECYQKTDRGDKRSDS